MMMRVRIAIWAVLMGSVSWTWAASERFNTHYRWEAPTVWQELDVALPSYPPSDAVWLRFSGGVRAVHRMEIEASSVRVESDGVVRYALRVTAASGAESLSYQALRCETAQYRIVAIGRAREQKWIPSRLHQWRDVMTAPPQEALFRDYLCEGRQPRSVEQILKQMQRG